MDDARRRERAKGRGRGAERPAEIPPRGWLDVLQRVRRELARDGAGLMAAGVAFYGLLAAFPALAAVVSIYGLLADPGDVTRALERLPALPAGSRAILTDQLDRIARSSDGALGFGLVAGLVAALWSASKGAGALLTAMNIAYDEDEDRGWLQRAALSLGFTAGAVAVGVVALAIVAGLPAVLGAIGLEDAARALLTLAPWPLLIALFLAGLGLLYRFGPSRSDARLRWLTPGAVLATGFWVLISALFTVYVGNFSSYNETYGSVGGVVVLLMWFWLTAYAVILGAELNAEAEHQTRRDTTTGPERPIGRRGAYVADTVGVARGEREGGA